MFVIFTKWQERRESSRRRIEIVLFFFLHILVFFFIIVQSGEGMLVCDQRPHLETSPRSMGNLQPKRRKIAAIGSVKGEKTILAN